MKGPLSLLFAIVIPFFLFIDALVCKETGVGNNGFVIVRGKQPKAKGRKNDLLILVQEEPDSNEIIYVNQLCVDGVRHKENEWYGIAD